MRYVSSLGTIAMIEALIGEITITQGGMLMLMAGLGFAQWQHHRDCKRHRKEFHDVDRRLEQTVAKLEGLVDRQERERG